MLGGPDPTKNGIAVPETLPIPIVLEGDRNRRLVFKGRF